MKLASITDRLVTHQDEHAMGIAAYMAMIPLVNYITSDAKSTIADILIEQCQHHITGYEEQDDKGKAELWTAVASHIKTLLS